jgi:hypothetical protein
MTEIRDGFPSGSSPSVSSDRREASRHDATRKPARMVARIIGGSEVRLLDISRRGVLLETQTRLQFGAKATIRFTTSDAAVSVRAQVVRSRVASLGESLVYHTALKFDEELHLADVMAHQQPAAAAARPIDPSDAIEPTDSIDAIDATSLTDSIDEPDHPMFDTDSPFALDGSVKDDNGEILLAEMLNLLVSVDDDLENLQRRADAHGNA